MIQVTEHITIDDNEIELNFIRASGPGGQHADRSATAVQLRFDVLRSKSLPESVRWRLMELAGNRITEDGTLIIEAKQHRHQDKNRQDAINRLVRLVRRATQKPKIRRKTRPTRASQERRLRRKHRRSEIKRLRKPPKPERW